MASIPCVLIVLLICLSQDHMGVQGKIPSVFSSVGGNVTLPCRNVVYSKCSSTTWLSSSSGTLVGLVYLGKIRHDVATHGAKRLSLDSDCSLHITDVTTEDAGVYYCQQYLREDGPQYREDAEVYLSVLQDVPLVAGVVVSVSLLAAALMIIVVICKRRTNAGGEPRHQSTQSRTSAIVMPSVQPPDSSANKEEGADLHYAAFQHLKPTQAGPSAKQSEENVTYSTLMQLSGGEDQNNARPAGRPVDPNDLYANVQKNNNIQN